MCDVTLSVYPHRAGLKNMPGHGGIRTYDLWNTSPRSSVGRVAQLAEHWASIPKVVGSNPTVPGIFFKPARCGYTLRVTSLNNHDIFGKFSVRGNFSCVKMGLRVFHAF